MYTPIHTPIQDLFPSTPSTRAYKLGDLHAPYTWQVRVWETSLKTVCIRTASSSWCWQSALQLKLSHTETYSAYWAWFRQIVAKMSSNYWQNRCNFVQLLLSSRNRLDGERYCYLSCQATISHISFWIIGISHLRLMGVIIVFPLIFIIYNIK